MPWKSASKINEWMIKLWAPSSGETREFIRHATLTVHYGVSLAVECTSVVHSLLQYIVGLNECTREHGFDHHLKWLSPQIMHYLRV